MRLTTTASEAIRATQLKTDQRPNRCEEPIQADGLELRLRAQVGLTHQEFQAALGFYEATVDALSTTPQRAQERLLSEALATLLDRLGFYTVVTLKRELEQPSRRARDAEQLAEDLESLRTRQEQRSQRCDAPLSDTSPQSLLLP